MIIEAVAAAFIAVLTTLTSPLPDAGDLGLTVADGWLRGYAWLDALLPLHEALAAGAVLVAMMGVIALVRALLAVWAAIPGKLS